MSSPRPERAASSLPPPRSRADGERLLTRDSAPIAGARCLLPTRRSRGSLTLLRVSGGVPSKGRRKDSKERNVVLVRLLEEDARPGGVLPACGKQPIEHRPVSVGGAMPADIEEPDALRDVFCRKRKDDSLRIHGGAVEKLQHGRRRCVGRAATPAPIRIWRHPTNPGERGPFLGDQCRRRAALGRIRRLSARGVVRTWRDRLGVGDSHGRDCAVVGRVEVGPAAGGRSKTSSPHVGEEVVWPVTMDSGWDGHGERRDPRRCVGGKRAGSTCLHRKQG